AAARGQEDDCRSHADHVREAASRTGAALAGAIAEWAVGLLELGTGNPDQAAGRLQALTTDDPAVSHPFYALASAPDRIEALVRGGQEDLAGRALEDFDDAITSGAPDWLLASAA